MAASSIRRASSSSSVLACLEDTEERSEEDQDHEHGCLTLSSIRVTEPVGIKNIRRWYLLIEVDGWFLQVDLKSQYGFLSAMYTHASFQNVTSASRVRFELWATKSRGRHPDRIVALGLLEPTAKPIFQLLSAATCVYDLSMHVLEPYASNMTNPELLGDKKKKKKSVHSFPSASSSASSSITVASSSYPLPSLPDDDSPSNLELTLRLQLGFSASQQDRQLNQPRRLQLHLTSDCQWIIPSATSREYVAMLLEAMVGRSSLLEQKKRDRGKFGALHRAIDRLAKSKHKQERPGRSDLELRLLERTNQDVYHQLGLLPKHRRRHRRPNDEDDDGYEEDDEAEEDEDKNMCYVCLTDYVDFGRQVLKLDCQHVLHFECAQAQIRSIARQRGRAVGFAQAKCGVCRSWLEHQHLNRALADIRKLYEVTVRLAERAWEAEEGGDGSREKPSGDELLTTMRFYSCYQCNEPFYGGRIECGDAIDPQPEQVVCERCLRRAIEHCPQHGTDFIAFKCRWCCQPSSYFCFGHTHFCSPCHQLYPNMKVIPCPGPPVCEGTHPPNDGLTEHCLGCVACHAERNRPLPPPPTPPPTPQEPEVEPQQEQVEQPAQAELEAQIVQQAEPEPRAEPRNLIEHDQEERDQQSPPQQEKAKHDSGEDDQYDESGNADAEHYAESGIFESE